MIFETDDEGRGLEVPVEAAFTDKWRREFTLKEGFLPSSSRSRPMPPPTTRSSGLHRHAAQRQVRALIPNWEQMADTTAGALQKIYLGQVQPDAALKEAASQIDALIQQGPAGPRFSEGRPMRRAATASPP